MRSRITAGIFVGLSCLVVSYILNGATLFTLYAVIFAAGLGAVFNDYVNRYFNIYRRARRIQVSLLMAWIFLGALYWVLFWGGFNVANGLMFWLSLIHLAYWFAEPAPAEEPHVRPVVH